MKQPAALRRRAGLQPRTVDWQRRPTVSKPTARRAPKPFAAVSAGSNPHCVESPPPAPLGVSPLAGSAAALRYVSASSGVDAMPGVSASLGDKLQDLYAAFAKVRAVCGSLRAC